MILLELQGGETTSGDRKRGAPDAVRGGKEGLSADVSIEFPQTLIAHESRVAYTINQELTPTSIAELLYNYVFRSSLDISDPRLLGTFFHLFKPNAQSEASNLKPMEELFADSKRQVLLVPSLFSYIISFFHYHTKCLFILASSQYPCQVGGEDEGCSRGCLC